MSRASSPAAAFVVAASRAFVTESRSCPAPPPGEDWISLAQTHGVLPQVLVALEAAGHGTGALGRWWRTSRTARALRTFADLTWLTRTLGGSDIAWVVLKGPVLSEVVYDRSGVRDFADLDILLSPQDMRKALEILVAAGAEMAEVDWTQATWTRAAEAPLWLPSGTLLDLHWSTINRAEVRRAYAADTTAILARRQLVTIDGQAVPIPADLDFCRHVMVHACLDGCARLRCLVDAHQCVRWLDGRLHTPSDFAQHTAQWGSTPAVGSVLRRGERYLDPSLHRWAEALAPGTRWTRTIDLIDSLNGPGRIAGPLTRKMNRHTSPTSAASLSAVLGRQRQRLGQLRERSHVPRVTHGPPLDAWLDYVERQA